MDFRHLRCPWRSFTSFLGASAFALLAVLSILSSVANLAMIYVAIGAFGQPIWKLVHRVLGSFGRPAFLLLFFLAALAIGFAGGWAFEWVSEHSTPQLPTPTSTPATLGIGPG
jgi:Mn2+/Fe2+ NRAMP family transporter